MSLASLPLQMPADMDTVEEQDEDRAFDMRVYIDSEGHAYDFALWHELFRSYFGRKNERMPRQEVKLQDTIEKTPLQVTGYQTCSATEQRVFDPRGSQQISMQAWLLGSLLAGIKKGSCPARFETERAPGRLPFYCPSDCFWGNGVCCFKRRAYSAVWPIKASTIQRIIPEAFCG